MLLLGGRLKRAGFVPSSFGYQVRRNSFDDIAERWTAHLSEVTEHDRLAAGTEAPTQYAIIGHSLGNIITRYATPALPAGLQRFIMLAPPNSPPVLAQTFKENPFYRVLTGDAGQRLADPSFYDTLERPRVPTLIFAGDRGPRARWLPFRGEASDGIVALDETRLHDVPHRTVRAVHTFIMNDREVTRTITHFLESGRLDEDAAEPA
jgi:pimeloyl-ACP methyl ester carboxylesterase